jgi:hypothetical protein
MIELKPEDPKNRKELEQWLRQREAQFPGEPLSAREYLMVERINSPRPRYSIR